MIPDSEIIKLKNLSLREIRRQVSEIRHQKPSQERKIITFSRNFTLSLSNYCINNCSYCFYNHRIPKSGKEKNSVLIDTDEMMKIIEMGLKYRCKEALLISGENPEHFDMVKNEIKRRGFENYLAFLKKTCSIVLAKNLLPHTNIGVLSFKDLKELKKYNASMGLMLESTSQILTEKGSCHEFSPGKEPSIRISHIENAGKLKIPFTTGLLIGIGESVENRIQDLFKIRDIHNKFGHIQEVIIQNFIYKQGIAFKPKKPSRIKDLLKVTGIAKIVFQNEIPIQVPPNLITGYEKDFLEMGIDDFGGISPFSIDYINPKNAWPQIEELKRICSNQGYRLMERLPVYEKYILKDGFISENIKKKIHVYN